MNNFRLINAKYKLTFDEIKFLVDIIQNITRRGVVELDATKYDIKFVKRMIGKYLEISCDEDYYLLNWFSAIEYENTQRIFYITLNPDIRDFLQELKLDLTPEDLVSFFSLNSNYSRAIFKLLKVHQHKKVAVVNVEDLKQRLQVPKALQTYSNFKMKVLNVTQEELKKYSDISFELQEIKEGKKVTKLRFIILEDFETKEEIQEDTLSGSGDIMLIEEPKETIPIIKPSEDFNTKIKRVVNFFDQERRKIQKNYVRQEYKNIDGEYLLRVHLKESGRTPEMFFDAVRWLFSNNPEAAFHRQYIMNITKLIEHYNTLEHQAMYSKKAIEFSQEAQTWYNVYKKQGFKEEEILEKLKEGGYLS